MSNNPKNRWRNYSGSARGNDKRKSDSTPGVPVQVATTPGRIYDLELDASLRAFTRISNDNDFVDAVMEKVAASNSEVSPEVKSRKRLQTIAPAFVDDSDQDDDLTVQKKQLEIDVTSNKNQTKRPKADRRTTSNAVRVLVVASCLFVAAIGVYFLIPAGTPDQQHIVDSEKPAAMGLAADDSGETLKQLPVHSPIEGIEIPSQIDWVKTPKPEDAPASTVSKEKALVDSPLVEPSKQPEIIDVYEPPTTEPPVIASDKLKTPQGENADAYQAPAEIDAFETQED